MRGSARTALGPHRARSEKQEEEEEGGGTNTHWCGAGCRSNGLGVRRIAAGGLGALGQRVPPQKQAA